MDFMYTVRTLIEQAQADASALMQQLQEEGEKETADAISSDLACILRESPAATSTELASACTFQSSREQLLLRDELSESRKVCEKISETLFMAAELMKHC